MTNPNERLRHHVTGAIERGEAVAITEQKPFDTVQFIMDFEGGELDTDEVIEGFQHLIDTGLVWQLQGSYGRAATALIQQGYCTPKAT